MREKVKEILSNPESKQIVHEAFSGGCFNKCWTLIEKEDRSPEDVEDMLLLAQARAEVLNKDFKAAGSCLDKAEKELDDVTDKDEKEFLETDIAELRKTIQG